MEVSVLLQLQGTDVFEFICAEHCCVFFLGQIYVLLIIFAL
jgi:hypothetical protein